MMPAVRADVDPVEHEFRLEYQYAFDWEAILAFFGFRAIAGIEDVRDGVYRRSIGLIGAPGMLEVRHAAGESSLVATVRTVAEIDEVDVRMRLRRTFDLDTDLAAVAKHLSRDPDLADMIARRPAIRVPAHWDPFETAIRAILGQQVSLTAARRLNARLVERAGVAIAAHPDGGPDRLFPTPRQVIDADLSNMGMPGARVRTLQAMAQALLDDPLMFRRGQTAEETVGRLCVIKGIGPWTAQYIAIRACREPDGFPASDAGLLRGSADANGVRPTANELAARAEKWRPYRAYAAQHIWAEDEDAVIAKR